MLVLTRKQNEEIQIGDDIRLTVLRIKGNTVRLGIQAPPEVRVVRGELPPRETVKQMTVMVTDTKTGKVTEQWSGPSATTQSMPSRLGLNDPSAMGDQDVRSEVNRLRQIVDHVKNGDWKVDATIEQE